MRTRFIETLCRLAQEDERIWLICGDLGYSVLEVFRDRFPKRYLNAGVAEQNMTTMAAGLAHSGKIVFTYSIANFPVMRCLEQIRNDVCYHNLPVKVVAVGGGLAYGTQGYTHHGVEDLAVTRVLPNMTVFAPGDPWEAECVTESAAALPGPCYIRLGKAGESTVHEDRPAFRVGEPIVIRTGSDVTILSTGGMLVSALAAADFLQTSGISAGVVSVPTVHPFNDEAILSNGKPSAYVATVEEHAEGGLATVVAERIAFGGYNTRLIPLRLTREPLSVAGSQEELRHLKGLSPQAIASTIQNRLSP